MEWKDIRHFKKEEFNHPEMLDLETLSKLDNARTFSGIPYKINSDGRTVEENNAVGGKKQSSHLKGLAYDIAARNSITRNKVIYGLIMAGFSRIGIAKTFIHADNDKDKVQGVIWVY
jgi:hypothetical protein